jgi:hypothetical protein
VYRLNHETRLARSTHRDDLLHCDCDCRAARSSELSHREIVPDLSGSERAAESRAGSCRPAISNAHPALVTSTFGANSKHYDELMVICPIDIEFYTGVLAIVLKQGL